MYTSRTVMVSKLDKQTIVSKFGSYWVPILVALCQIYANLGK